MRYIIGNVLQPMKGDGIFGDEKKTPFIAHLGNNRLVLRAGVAAKIAAVYPSVVESLKKKYKREGELGWYDIVMEQIKYPDGTVVPGFIVTMIAQTLNVNRFPISMPHLEDVINDVDHFAKDYGGAVHIPRIGTGLARGRWEDIVQLIPDSWTVYTLPQELKNYPDPGCQFEIGPGFGHLFGDNEGGYLTVTYDGALRILTEGYFPPKRDSEF